MRRHIDVLGHGMRFYGALLAALGTLGGVLVAGMGLAVHEPAMVWLAPLVAGGGFAAGSVPWITGNGILARRPWARPVGLVVSMLLLGDVPIGASLGLLGLGVLLDNEVAGVFRDPSSPRIASLVAASIAVPHSQRSRPQSGVAYGEG